MLWITGSKGLLARALADRCKAALHKPSGAPNEASSVGHCIAALHKPNGVPNDASSVGHCIAALHKPSGVPNDASSVGHCIAALHTGREVDIGSVSEVRAFVQKHPGITHIVNCAAFNRVDDAELIFREEAYRTNVVGPENLSLVAEEMGAKFIHLSSDYVFPGSGRVALREEDPAAPCNHYGMTKWEGEKRALSRSACVIRTSWIFGVGGRIFVSNLLEKLLREKEVRLSHDQWSKFTYAPDLAGAILQMLDREGLYHYANQGVATRYEFGLALREEALLLGYPVVTESILPVASSSFSPACQRPVYSPLDTGKIEQYLTIRSWRAALRDFLCAHCPAYS